MQRRLLTSFIVYCEMNLVYFLSFCLLNNIFGLAEKLKQGEENI